MRTFTAYLAMLYIPGAVIVLTIGTCLVLGLRRLYVCLLRFNLHRPAVPTAGVHLLKRSYQDERVDRRVV